MSYLGSKYLTTKGDYNKDLADLMFGSRGECRIESLDSEKDFCIGLFKDGVWESRRTDIGMFSYLKQECNIPYLNKNGELFFEMFLPLVPYGYLLSIVDFFREIMVIHKGAEAMVQVWWDKIDEEYVLYVPKQEVGGASVDFTHSEELQDNTNMIWVVDIHSHNTMNAFFSGGDDADEKSTRLFGVIGEISPTSWSGKWRSGCNGQYVELGLEDIFDKTFSDDLFVFTKDDIAKVSKVTYASYYTRPINKFVNKHLSRSSHGYDYGKDSSIYPSSEFGKDFKSYDADNYSDIELKLAADLELSNIFKTITSVNDLELFGEDNSAELKLLIEQFMEYLSYYLNYKDVCPEAILSSLYESLKSNEFRRLIKNFKDV